MTLTLAAYVSADVVNSTSGGGQLIIGNAFGNVMGTARLFHSPLHGANGLDLLALTAQENVSSVWKTMEIPPIHVRLSCTTTYPYIRAGGESPQSI